MAILLAADHGTNAVQPSSTTATITTTGTVAAGNRLILDFVAFLASAGSAAPTVSGGGLTWQTDAWGDDGASGHYAGWASADCPAGLAPGTVLTITFVAAMSDKGIGASSWSGIVAGSTQASYRGVNGVNAGATSTWSTGARTIAAGSMLMGVAHEDSSGRNVGAPTAPSILLHDFAAGGAGDDQTSAYRIEAVAGSYTVAGTWTPAGSASNITAYVEYLASSGPVIEDRDAPGTFGPALPDGPPGMRFRNPDIIVPNEPHLTRPLHQLHLTQAWDVAMQPQNQAQFESFLDFMTGYQGTPQWSYYKAWNAPFLPVAGYVNVFGEGVYTWPQQLDSDGATLYLPFGTPDPTTGAYERSSRDLRSQAYRDLFVNACMAILGDGGEGIFLDDVNVDIGNMFKRAFGAAPLTNFDTGAYYTSPVTGQTGWVALLADFCQEVTKRVKDAHPTARFLFNTQWAWVLTNRWRDARVRRLLETADYITIEHGASDTGIYGGPGTDGTGQDFAWRSLWFYIKYLHSLGKSVITFSRSGSYSNRRYEMSHYHTTRDSSVRDMIGVWNDNNVWPNLDPVYSYDLDQRIGLTVDDGNLVSALFKRGYSAFIPGDFKSGLVVPDSLRDSKISADTPTVWWKFDDQEAPWKESVGTLALTQTGNPVYDGSGYTYASGESAAVADAPALRLNNTNWTLEFEITAPNPLPAAGFPAVLSKGWATIGGWQCYFHTANTALNYWGTADLATSIVLVAGETALVAVTYDSAAAMIRFYKNGVLTSGPVAYTANSETADPFWINKAQQGDPASGWRFGRIAIFASQLSATQLRTHYLGQVFLAELAGSPAGIGSAAGALAFGALLSGTAAGIGSATGTVSTTSGALLSGTAAGISTAVGALAPLLTGTSAGTSTAVGAVAASALVTGTSAGVGTTTGALTVSTPQLSGSSAGVGAITGLLITSDISNNLDGGTQGVTITAANSGGASGTPFDVVNIGTGGAMTFDNAHPRQTLALKTTNSGATAARCNAGWTTTIGTRSVIWYRFYLYVTAYTSIGTAQGMLLARVFTGNTISAGTSRCALAFTSTGKLQLMTAAPAVMAGTTQVGTVPLNTLVRIEVQLTLSAAAAIGSCIIRYFQSPESTTPTETLSNTAVVNNGGTGDSYCFGICDTDTNVGTFWFDDIAVSATGFIGPVPGPPLVGNSDGVGAATGTLTTTTGAVLTGTAAGVGAVTGALSASSLLTGIAAGIGTTTGSILVPAALTGTAAGIGAATGTLTVAGVAALTGTTAGVGAATGALAATSLVTGTTAGTGVATGALLATSLLTGTAAGVGAATGALTASPRLSGTTAGVGVATGAVSTVPGTVEWRSAGAVTTTTVTVASHLIGASSARLKVATDSGLTTGVIFSGAQSPDANGYAKYTVSGLSANTQYFYGIEVDGAVVTSFNGKFKTAPSGAASFTIGFGSCCDQGATADSTAMGLLHTRNPDLVINCGDLFYGDVATNDQPAIRGFWENRMTTTNHKSAYGGRAAAYTWSDHDYGPDNSDSTSLSNPASNAVYRQVWPHYALASGGATGVYQTFVWGRIRFILTDTRSFRSPNANTDNSSKTVLGTTQKQWFKDTLSQCAEQIIIWVEAEPWINVATAGADDWGGFTTERTELANFILASGKQVVMLSGDMHALAYDDGTNAVGGNAASSGDGIMMVCHASPLNNNASTKGGPYTAGVFPSGTAVTSQYGFVTITDTGTSQVTIDFKGYDSADVQRMSGVKTLVLAGLISGTAAGTGTATGALTFTAALSGTAAGTGVATGAPTASPLLSGAPAGTSTATGALVATALLSGVSAAVGAATGTPRVTMLVAGTAAGAGAATGVLSRPEPLSGTTAGTSAATGVLGAGTPVLFGTAAGVGSATGALTVASQLSGAAAGNGTATGALAATALVTGTTAGVGVATGTLTVPGLAVFTGTAAGVGSAAGALTAAPLFTGTASGVGSATGALITTAALSGTTAGAGTAVGALAATSLATGTAAAVGTVTGALAATASLVGVTAGVGAAAGTLGTTPQLAGASAGTGTTTATLTVPGIAVFSGTMAGTGTATGAVGGAPALSGTAAGTGAATGTIFIPGIAVLIGTANGVAATQGAITAMTMMTGLAVGNGGMVGVLASRIYLAGTAVGIGTLTGSVIGIVPVKMSDYGQGGTGASTQGGGVGQEVADGGTGAEFRGTVWSGP